MVADTQGYFSVLGSGPPPTCLKEQFFARDYDPLRYDQAGWCEDATTQEVCYSTALLLGSEHVVHTLLCVSLTCVRLVSCRSGRTWACASSRTRR